MGYLSDWMEAERAAQAAHEAYPECDGTLEVPRSGSPTGLPALPPRSQGGTVVSAMDRLGEAAEEMAATFAMIAERQPGMAAIMDEKRAELAAWMEEQFRPYTDLADGKITADEFTAQVAERAAAERQRRRDHYGDGPIHDVTCEACGAEHEWDEDEQGGDPPPIYFECEDLDGVSCHDDDEPARYQGEGDWSDGS